MNIKSCITEAKKFISLRAN